MTRLPSQRPMARAAAAAKKILVAVLLVVVFLKVVFPLHWHYSTPNQQEEPASRAAPTFPNQVSHVTSYNRYPRVYKHVVRFYENAKTTFPPKILSFGSSTGKEALTLALNYFPTSPIVGVDVDNATLWKARQNTHSVADRVFFFDSSALPLDMLGIYDIIFANSVLCRHPWKGPGAYPFSVFEDTIRKLDKVLRVGGLLVLINTSYRMEDTGVAKAYSIVDIGRCGNVIPLWSKDGATSLKLRNSACVYKKTR